MGGRSHSRIPPEGGKNHRLPESVLNLSRKNFLGRTSFSLKEDIKLKYLELLSSDYIREFRRVKHNVWLHDHSSMRIILLEAYEQLIEYATTGEVEMEGLDEATILDMLTLAHRYGLGYLASLLAQYLQNTVTVLTVCDMYVEAHRRHAYEIEYFCSRFMDLHADAVLRSESFRRLPAEVLRELLSRDTFHANEIDIFRAVMRWCRGKPRDEDTFDVLGKVRLPLISLEDLLKTVEPSNLIPKQRLAMEFSRRLGVSDTDSSPRGLLVIEANVATADYRASLVAQGSPPICTQQQNISQPLDWDQGTLKHDIGSPTGIVIALAKPYIINRLILDLYKPWAYSYYVEMSTGANDWHPVIDQTQQLSHSTQRLSFEPRVVRYIRVVGTYSTSGNKFVLGSIAAFYSERPFKLDYEDHATLEPMNTDCDFNGGQLNFCSAD